MTNQSNETIAAGAAVDQPKLQLDELQINEQAMLSKDEAPPASAAELVAKAEEPLDVTDIVEQQSESQGCDAAVLADTEEQPKNTSDDVRREVSSEALLPESSGTACEQDVEKSNDLEIQTSISTKENCTEVVVVLSPSASRSAEEGANEFIVENETASTGPVELLSRDQGESTEEAVTIPTELGAQGAEDVDPNANVARLASEDDTCMTEKHGQSPIEANISESEASTAAGVTAPAMPLEKEVTEEQGLGEVLSEPNTADNVSSDATDSPAPEPAMSQAPEASEQPAEMISPPVDTEGIAGEEDTNKCTLHDSPHAVESVVETVPSAEPASSKEDAAVDESTPNLTKAVKDEAAAPLNEMEEVVSEPLGAENQDSIDYIAPSETVEAEEEKVQTQESEKVTSNVDQDMTMASSEKQSTEGDAAPESRAEETVADSTNVPNKEEFETAIDELQFVDGDSSVQGKESVEAAPEPESEEVAAKVDQIADTPSKEEACAASHEVENVEDFRKQKEPNVVSDMSEIEEGEKEEAANVDQSPTEEKSNTEEEIAVASKGEEAQESLGEDDTAPVSSETPSAPLEPEVAERVDEGAIERSSSAVPEEEVKTAPTTVGLEATESRTIEEPGQASEKLESDECVKKSKGDVPTTPMESKKAVADNGPVSAKSEEDAEEIGKALCQAEKDNSLVATNADSTPINAEAKEAGAPVVNDLAMPGAVTLESSKTEASSNAEDKVPARNIEVRAQADEDFSYEEEIVLEEYEEVEEYEVEYVEEEFLEEEIVEEEEDSAEELTASSFTEVTYDSQDLVMEDVIQKSATQKKLEREEARKLAEAEEARRNMEFRLARQNSFAKKDDDLKRRLAEEEARHIREEEEREQQRVEAEERLAQIRAQEAATRIAQQQTEELRRLLEEEENRRKLAEAEARRLAAENSAREKAEADRKRREAEEAEQTAREEKRRQMEEEVRMLKEKLAEAKKAADAARQKQLGEKKRFQSKADPTKRKVKKVKKKSKDFNDSVQSTGTTTPMSPVCSQSPASQYSSPAKPTTPGGIFKSPKRESPQAAPSIPKSPMRKVASPIRPRTPQSTAPSTPVRRFSPTPPMVSPVKSVAKSPRPTPLSPAPTVESPAPISAVAMEGGPYYSLEELRRQSVPGLDYKNREIYLSPEDFAAVFGVDKAEFDTYPKWKKTNMKRKKKLF